MADRYGEAELADRFRAFDTICSATQDRQDALRELLREPLDLMLVIGGYNSSNTGHLLEIANEKVTAFHVEGPACLVSREAMRHKPVGRAEEVETTVDGGWLPEGDVTIGLTAGASTPDVVIGEVVARVLALRG
jgi:4-hydroxy-3-methylbut-2-enyl diphosphate reductase